MFHALYWIATELSLMKKVIDVWIAFICLVYETFRVLCQLLH